MITLLLVLLALIILAIPIGILVLVGMVSWELLVFLLICILLDFLLFRSIFKKLRG